MPIFNKETKDGGKEVNISYQTKGSAGPHWTFWGCKLCLHLYEDGEQFIGTPTLFAMAKAIEETQK